MQVGRRYEEVCIVNVAINYKIDVRGVNTGKRTDLRREPELVDSLNRRELPF